MMTNTFESKKWKEQDMICPKCFYKDSWEGLGDTLLCPKCYEMMEFLFVFKFLKNVAEIQYEPRS